MVCMVVLEGGVCKVCVMITEEEEEVEEERGGNNRFKKFLVLHPEGQYDKINKNLQILDARKHVNSVYHFHSYLQKSYIKH